MTSWSLEGYLGNQGADDDRDEDGVLENTHEDVPLSVDLTGVEFVEDLHEDKGVEDDGVVL